MGENQEAFGIRGGRRRYYDRALDATVVRVFQGDFYVTSNPSELLTTTLGSCVAVCVRDPIIRFGGMNHFVLPTSDHRGERRPTLAMRYGSYSIERLVNTVLAEGGVRERLEVKVFGGANIVEGITNIGCRNADFVERYLANEGIAISSQHLRGCWPRKLRYTPSTGLVQMREIQNGTAAGIFEQEKVLHEKTVSMGGVELFE